MTSLRLYHSAPFQVEWKEEAVKPPGDGEVLVRTHYSGISSGTELLFYRGEFPEDVVLDSRISSLRGKPIYPFRYGYCITGVVAACGPGVDASLLGRTIFAFQPHESLFVLPVSELICVPDQVDSRVALFFPHMETVVSLLHDAAPVLGDFVDVYGQGPIGLLTTALLSRIPALTLRTFDPCERRRKLSILWGAHSSEPPHDQETSVHAEKADVSLELSGNPEALNLALQRTKFTGKIVIGSWYGRRPLEVDLGGNFHRSRIQIVSSQVSTVNPALSGRWSRERRTQLVWRLLSEVPVLDLVTHCLPLNEANNAFRFLDEQKDSTMQVIIDFGKED